MAAGGATAAPLHVHVDAMVRSYCGSLSFEYSHMAAWEQQEWLQAHAEAPPPPYAAAAKRDILHHLIRAGACCHVRSACSADRAGYSVFGTRCVVRPLLALVAAGRLATNAVCSSRQR